MRLALFRLMAPLVWAALVWPSVGKAQSVGEAVLQTTGTLESGDAALTDGNLYDEYPFEGRAGQAVIVTLQSDAFDTYLLLVNSEGESVAQNDDWNGATDSTIGYVLPEDGTYQVWASAFNESGRGAYDIDISFAEPGHPIVLEAQADRLNQQGMSLLNRGEYLEAQTMFEQSLAIRQDIGDRRGEGESLNNIGGIYSRLGDYPKALDFYEQSLAIRQDIGDRRGEGTMLNNIGFIYDSLGDYPKALDFYEQSLAISQDIGDRRGEGTMLNNIGGIYSRLGDYPKALDFYEQSLAIRQDIGDRRGEGESLNNIGFIYSRLGDYPKAYEAFEDIGDRHRRSHRESLNVDLESLADPRRSTSNPRLSISIVCRRLSKVSFL